MLLDIALLFASFPTLCTVPDWAELAASFPHEGLHNILDFWDKSFENNTSSLKTIERNSNQQNRKTKPFMRIHTI